MSNTLVTFDKIYQIQKSYVGYLEKKSNSNLDSKTANAGYNNYTRFARDYKVYTGINLQAQAWCMMFQSVTLVEAFGLQKAKEILGGNLFHSCTQCYNSMYAKGRGTRYKNNVKPGYIIFFLDSDGTPGHVGFVTKVENGKVYTIEGNTSPMAGNKESLVANGGCVAEKWYDINSSKIYGYGIVEYETAKNGWLQESGKWYYYIDNKKQTNAWVQSEDKKDWYWVKSNGVMAEKEFIQDKKGNWYYLDPGGKARRGWLQDTDKRWYYLNPKKDKHGEECQMVTGFIDIEYKGKMCTFYFEEKSTGYRGEMYLNQTAQIKGLWYTFDENGVCLNPKGSTTKP